jgi:hypothetical protein
MRNKQIFPHIWGGRLSNMTLQLLHSKFPLYMRKILFSFSSVHNVGHICCAGSWGVVEGGAKTDRFSSGVRFLKTLSNPLAWKEVSPPPPLPPTPQYFRFVLQSVFVGGLCVLWLCLCLCDNMLLAKLQKRYTVNIVYRQSTRASVQSSELGPPTPSPASVCGSPPHVSWGGATPACVGGGRGTQFRRLDRCSGTLYSNSFTRYTLFPLVRWKEKRRLAVSGRTPNYHYQAQRLYQLTWIRGIGGCRAWVSVCTYMLTKCEKCTCRCQFTVKDHWSWLTYLSFISKFVYCTKKNSAV